ncbi:nucleoside monophosphate kinase [Deinococcus navajonensis]|uniref:Adenylate kinase n=1 Tax=Deinococcus navajonensis TaxID=309884 RepID=A0ABV8XJX6_9DEIO
MPTAQLIALVGPPCSGKGTLARRVKDHIGAVHLETGALLREEAENDPDLARRLEAGEMVSDEHTTGLLEKRLQQSWAAGQSVVLDGTPRRVSQLHLLLDGPYGQAGRLRVLALDVPPEVVKARALSRGEGRADDTEEGIEHRLEVYRQETQPLLTDPALHQVPFSLLSGVLPPEEIYSLAVQTLKAWETGT